MYAYFLMVFQVL